MLNRTLTALLLVQAVLCVISPGFSPAILIASLLMIAAPLACLRSMPKHGVLFLFVPCIAGIVLFQAIVLTPVFLVWFVLIAIASAICWSRGNVHWLLPPKSG